MNEFLLISLRNTLVFCLLSLTITLCPLPVLSIQRVVSRMRETMNTWHSFLQNRAGGGKFVEIDMSDEKQNL